MITETTTPQLDRSHIKESYQAAPRPTGRPGDLPVNNVWQDVFAYFKERFDEAPTLEVIALTEESLVSQMRVRFGNKYNPEMIAKLLKNGFWKEKNVGPLKFKYEFKREDFIRETVKREEEVQS